MLVFEESGLVDGRARGFKTTICLFLKKFKFS
jgi:hypothetical protein